VEATRLFLAGLVLAVAVSVAVGLNGYRASKTEHVPAVHSSGGFTLGGGPSSPAYDATVSWKPRWVFPAALFIAIAGAGTAAAVATTARA
jgi:hypothetical protein